MSERASVKCWPLKRTILLRGSVQTISATLLEGALAKIPKKGRRKPLFLIIDSEGGDFYAMLKIRGLLKKYERVLVTVVFGRAYSGAMTILQMGARRLMTQNSVLRFHQANHNFEKDQTLNVAEISKIVEQLRKIDAMQELIYIERAAPLPTPLLKKMSALFDEQAYLRYSQANEIRMVDEKIPEPKSLEVLIDYLQLYKAGIFL